MVFLLTVNIYTGDLVGAGTDTIAVTLTWAILTMCHHPQVQLKVQEEIDRFMEINKNLPTINDKEQLPYCFSVIKECMRYKPTTAFGVPHNVNKDGNYHMYILTSALYNSTNKYNYKHI